MKWTFQPLFAAAEFTTFSGSEQWINSSNCSVPEFGDLFFCKNWQNRQFLTVLSSHHWFKFSQLSLFAHFLPLNANCNRTCSIWWQHCPWRRKTSRFGSSQRSCWNMWNDDRNVVSYVKKIKSWSAILSSSSSSSSPASHLQRSVLHKTAFSQWDGVAPSSRWPRGRAATSGVCLCGFRWLGHSRTRPLPCSGCFSEFVLSCTDLERSFTDLERSHTSSGC